MKKTIKRKKLKKQKKEETLAGRSGRVKLSFYRKRIGRAPAGRSKYLGCFWLKIWFLTSPKLTTNSVVAPMLEGGPNAQVVQLAVQSILVLVRAHLKSAGLQPGSAAPYVFLVFQSPRAVKSVCDWKQSREG